MYIKKMIEELQQYTRKHLFNTVLGSNGGTEEQKHMRYIEKEAKMACINSISNLKNSKWITYSSQRQRSAIQI